VVTLLDNWWLAAIEEAYNSGAGSKLSLDTETCGKIFLKLENECLKLAGDGPHQRMNIELHGDMARSRMLKSGDNSVDREKYCDMIYGFCIFCCWGTKRSFGKDNSSRPASDLKKEAELEKERMILDRLKSLLFCVLGVDGATAAEQARTCTSMSIHMKVAQAPLAHSNGRFVPNTAAKRTAPRVCKSPPPTDWEAVRANKVLALSQPIVTEVQSKDDADDAQPEAKIVAAAAEKGKPAPTSAVQAQPTMQNIVTTQTTTHVIQPVTDKQKMLLPKISKSSPSLPGIEKKSTPKGNSNGTFAKTRRFGGS
jgi:hypothetical protein